MPVLFDEFFVIPVGILAGVNFAKAETNAVLIGLDANDAQGMHFAFLQNFLRMINAMIGHFGNMDQAFDIAFEPGKGAEFSQTGNDTFDQLSNAEFFELATSTDHWRAREWINRCVSSRDPR